MPDRTRRPSAGECIQTETLSAYIDSKLEVREREAVTTHLARCSDCFDVLSEVLRTQTELLTVRPVMGAAPASSSTPPAWAAQEPREVPGPVSWPGGDTVVRGAFGRRKAVWGVAGGVLAAAAMVLVVRLEPTWWTGVDPKLADLVEAVGGVRTVEARLTGGFKYGSLRSPVRSGGRTGPTDNLLLLAAAGRIRENAEKNPTAENVHASGVASLLVGEVDGAIRILQNAMSIDDVQPAIANSLSAAYLSKYSSHGQEGDLQRALELADRALQLDPDMPEALFNRALVLEATGERRAALGAWEAYLRVDTASRWATEARKRRAAVQSSLAESDAAR